MKRVFAWPTATGGRCLKCKKIIWQAKHNDKEKTLWDLIKDFFGFKKRPGKYCGGSLCVSTGEAPIV